ncbi:flagellar filament 34.5 kDa core protein (Class B) [Treponema primitia ZAS-2]|uniref:Flagellin n=2 Tax=Treponema primitia TaxID=88058 RepID=F5YN79_TREPZ|nr:flagellar filament 34.5 kDa core protein (Class B) [Treponema primitia ZAS-2]
MCPSGLRGIVQSSPFRERVGRGFRHVLLKQRQGCRGVDRRQGTTVRRKCQGSEFMIINHNLSAMFADRSLKVTQVSLDKNMEKLSSGLRINRAGDDASGLAVSEKMRSQIRGLNQASSNAQNGISFIQTTEGYLQETQDIIQRIRELAVQSSNGVYTDEDRMYIQVEVSQLIDEVDRIASHAQFNGMNLLTGRFGRIVGENVVTASMWFHIGANMDQREQVFIGTMTAKGLGVRNVGDESILTLSTPDNANRAIGTLDEAIKKINKQRADLGAYQNRLEHAVRGLDVGAENMQASESRIRDTNMASEMVNFTKNQILNQAGTAMLAQANQKGQTVLQLLQ